MSTQPDYKTEWGLTRDPLDLNETDQKMEEYITNIEVALTSLDYEIQGKVAVYETEFGGEYTDEWSNHNNLISSEKSEFRQAIEDYDGMGNGETQIERRSIEDGDDLTELTSDPDTHILGASLEYTTELGKAEFYFYSPDVDRSCEEDCMPFSIEIYGEELEKSVGKEIPEINHQTRLSRIRDRLNNII